MKKIVAILLSGLLLFGGVTTLAKPGDILGQHFATDIKTYLNGAQIEAINVDGETFIRAEAMENYGFFVWWDGEARTLSIEEKRTGRTMNPPAVPEETRKTGTPLGYYYETDIVTTLAGEPVFACNTDGKTYIHAEKLREHGYDVVWDPVLWQLDITSPVAGGYVYDLPLCDDKEQTEQAIGTFSLVYSKDGITQQGDKGYFILDMHAAGDRYTFDVRFYQNAGLFYSDALLNTLKGLCYDGFGVEIPCPKSEKYELVNKSISIEINGHTAQKVSVTAGAGNGHRDFYIVAEDLPKFSNDEINEIVFEIG